jgi:RNA repair, ligase-Pnkp-associating, region of Hen1
MGVSSAAQILDGTLQNMCSSPSFSPQWGSSEPTRIISTMLLTLTTTHKPATDLGYLLHKNPAKLHSFELSFGKAHVFYPEATAERCTAALLLDVDPVGLVRG